MIRINGVDRQSQVDVPYDMNVNMYHVAGMRNVYEPARSTDFEFVITGLEGLINVATGQPFGDEVQDILRFAVATCPIPHYDIDILKQRRGNAEQTFAGTPTFQSGTITLRDWVGADVKAILMSWQNQASNIKTGKTGTLTDYKRDAYLIERSPDGQIIRQWIVYGCWCAGIQEDPFNNRDNQQERIITATIPYDMAVLDQNF